ADGRLDLAVANRFSNDLSVLPVTGDNTFAPQTRYGTETSPSGVAVGDLDGDGRLDVVTANESNPGSVTCLMGNQDGTFDPPVDFGLRHAALDVEIADANGDGRLD